LETSDGGYILSATTSSNDGDVSGHFPYSIHIANNFQDSADGWVVKLDKNGIIEWQKCIGGSGVDQAMSIIQLYDGGYIVTGSTTTNDEGWFNHGNSDAFLIRLNSAGDMLWHKLYGGTGDDYAVSILQTTDHGFIFAGKTYSNDGDVNGLHGLPKDATGDIWVVRLDSNMNILWQRCYGGTKTEWCSRMISSTAGGYIIVGSTASADGDVTGYHQGIKNSSDAWVLHVDSLGNIIWQNCLGGSSFDFASSVIQTEVGRYVIVGNTLSSDGDISGKYGDNNSNDVWVVGLSPSGTIDWQKCLGGTREDRGGSIVETSDKGYLIGGVTNSTDSNISGNHGLYDIWLVKLSPFINSIEYSGGPSNFANPYPNPSIDIMRLEISHTSVPNQVFMYNSFGMQCFPNYVIEGTTLSVDMHNYAAGMYLIRVTYPNTSFEEVRKFLHHN
jgi:hypothetical protein